MDALELMTDGQPSQLPGMTVSLIYLGSHARHLVRIGRATVRVLSAPVLDRAIGNGAQLSAKGADLRGCSVADADKFGREGANVPT